MRVAAFVDGFNLYHAINDLGRPDLKWVDLWKLCAVFAPGPDLVAVHYFSAYATWRPNSFARHRALVAALHATGVQPVLGRFKAKSAACLRCGATWTAHEEKETDVNIALQLVLRGLDGEFDRALLFSGDSDLAPAVREQRARRPEISVRIVFPRSGQRSFDLIRSAGGKDTFRELKVIHLERSRLPDRVHGAAGDLAAECPPEYRVPAPPPRS
jgi:hypothetical protein